jgi:nuclear transport factor 2 (NTF2) superfamily protein
MKVAIHQPEHFPYMGFFEKMKQVDLFVILDDVQYKKNNWQNRNKFLNKNGVEEFFSVQVEKEATKKLIKDVDVVDGVWRKKVIKKIQQNFNIDVSHIYSHNKLIDINMNSIIWVREKLNINTPIIHSSDLHINTKSTQRLVDICNEVGATEYISGEGGKDYLDKSLFKDIKIIYSKPELENNYSSIYNVKTI